MATPAERWANRVRVERQAAISKLEAANKQLGDLLKAEKADPGLVNDPIHLFQIREWEQVHAEAVAEMDRLGM